MEPRESHTDAPSEDSFDSSATTVALGNAPAAQPRPAPPVLVLSEDPMLLEAMAAAVLDLAATIVSPSADRFVDQLVASDVELVLIDTATAPQDLADFLNSLRRQFPQLQMLVAGPGTVQHLIASQMTDGTVFRFAHKPASAQRLRLFVDAALRERQARITQQILQTSLPGVVAGADGAGSRPRPWWATVAVAFVLTVAAAGLVVWYETRPEHPVSADSSDQTVQADAAPEPAPQIAAAAPAASPVSDMAAQAAAEQEAIDRAAAERSERSEKERLAAEMEARQAALSDQIRRSAKEDAQLALGDDKDTQLRPSAPAAQSQAPATSDASAAATSTPAPALATVPAPTPPAVVAEVAPSEPASSASATASRADTADAVTEPPVKTRAATVASSQVLPESALHRVTFVAPDYPQDALLHQQGGTVELEFTVTPEGTVTDIKITGSDPRGVFDHASVMALAHDRYEPVMRDGTAVAQRAHIRLRFTP